MESNKLLYKSILSFTIFFFISFIIGFKFSIIISFIVFNATIVLKSILILIVPELLISIKKFFSFSLNKLLLLFIINPKVFALPKILTAFNI